MRQILVLGAGQSATFLIAYLLDSAEREDWFVTVGDVDLELARRRIDRHPRGAAVHFDVNDAELRSAQIAHADLVLNLLPAAFQELVAADCIHHARHMISVSYRNQTLRDMDTDAKRKGVMLLFEMGLDPGIDHMSAMSLIERLHDEGGRIAGFTSYGSGIPAPGQALNPLRYVITWDPRNVVMAGFEGAQYMEDGRVKIVPFHQVFHHTWGVEVEGVGHLEAYANRDSLSYMQAFGLEDVRTMIRGTLRYPGWSETWAQIVRLGLPNETLRIPDLANRTYADVIEMFLPAKSSSASLERRAAGLLQISPTGRIMENLCWLGLFSDERIGCPGDTAAAMMSHLLKQKLSLTPNLRDMVVLVHELDVEYPQTGRDAERINSTLVVEGTNGGFTAMATTVGLPVGIAAKLLLRDELPLTGCLIPTHPTLYEPILAQIAESGLRFVERRSPLVKS